MASFGIKTLEVNTTPEKMAQTSHITVVFTIESYSNQDLQVYSKFQVNSFYLGQFAWIFRSCASHYFLLTARNHWVMALFALKHNYKQNKVLTYRSKHQGKFRFSDITK